MPQARQNQGGDRTARRLAGEKAAGLLWGADSWHGWRPLSVPQDLMLCRRISWNRAVFQASSSNASRAAIDSQHRRGRGRQRTVVVGSIAGAIGPRAARGDGAIREGALRSVLLQVLHDDQGPMGRNPHPPQP